MNCAYNPNAALVTSHVVYLRNTYSLRQSGRVCLEDFKGSVHNQGFFLASAVWRMTDVTEYISRELSSVGLTVYRDSHPLCSESDITVDCALKKLSTRCFGLPLISRCLIGEHFTCRFQSISGDDEKQYIVQGRATEPALLDDTTIFGRACSKASGELASKLIPDVVTALQ